MVLPTVNAQKMTMDEFATLVHAGNHDKNTMDIVSCLGGIDKILTEYIRITQRYDEEQLLNEQQMQEIAQIISTAPHPLDGEEQKDDEQENPMNIMSNESGDDDSNSSTASVAGDLVTDLDTVQGDDSVTPSNPTTQDTEPGIEVKVSMSNMKPKLQDIHRICYCQRGLIDADDMDEDEGWRCHSCCRLINESVNFWCNGGEECIYQKISDSAYVVCSECFNMEIEKESDQKEKELVHEESSQSTLIIDKIEASLKKIS